MFCAWIAHTIAAQQLAPIDLPQAISLAQTNEPTFAAAAAAAKVANLDQKIARSALLPTVVYHNQYLYTQGGSIFLATPGAVVTGTSTPRFIANNAVHEYISQGSVTETIGAQQFNAVSQATAALAIARAEEEIARRGLVATVASLYYGTLAADRKLAVAQRAADEANSFTTLTQQREQGREVAHADVVKAQLQQQQRERDLADAKLASQKARLDLAVLLFPDPRAPYTLSAASPALPPTRADVESALARRNPELQSALVNTRLANLNVTAARLAYLPDLALNYSYGIDAARFTAHNSDGSRNLGYSVSATLDIPIWDWFATHNRVRQSQIEREVASKTLTNTQRGLIANLEEFYAEATVAHDQLDSLTVSAATAADSLRLTRLRYTAGEATVLEVVDAQNSLTTSEIAREDGITRYQAALANLQILTGTL